MKGTWQSAAIGVLAGASLFSKPTFAGTLLGTDGAQFTVNGRPAFLLGISYYGALGAPEEFIRKDLKDLQRNGFCWLRVWATWRNGSNDVSAVDMQGHGREPFLGKLKWLVAECDERGLVVDVTLTRGSRLAGGSLPDLAAHRQAIRTLVAALKQHRNWYFDLANERDVRDDRQRFGRKSIPSGRPKVAPNRKRPANRQRAVHIC